MKLSEAAEWCKKKMTRENMIVLALSGILLLVIALPTGKKEETETGTIDSGTKKAGEDTQAEWEEYSEEQALERRLEQFLSCMEGAGKVKVMISFAASKEQVVEKDVPQVSSQTQETDSAGGSRSQTTEDSREDTVYTADQRGNQVPYVKKTLAARIEGVTVLAEGGGRGDIQKNITDVIVALFGLEPHKIKVAKMVTAGIESAAADDE